MDTEEVPPAAEKPSDNAAGNDSQLCKVQGCTQDMNLEKPYYKRYSVCSTHLRSLELLVDGRIQRFCQQCGKFQDIADFDDVKRSCRQQLARHSLRRRIKLSQRRMQRQVEEQAAAAAAAAAGTSAVPGPGGPGASAVAAAITPGGRKRHPALQPAPSGPDGRQESSPGATHHRSEEPRVRGGGASLSEDFTASASAGAQRVSSTRSPAADDGRHTVEGRFCLDLDVPSPNRSQAPSRRFVGGRGTSADLNEAPGAARLVSIARASGSGVNASSGVPGAVLVGMDRAGAVRSAPSGARVERSGRGGGGAEDAATDNLMMADGGALLFDPMHPLTGPAPALGAARMRMQPPLSGGDGGQGGRSSRQQLHATASDLAASRHLSYHQQQQQQQQHGSCSGVMDGMGGSGSTAAFRGADGLAAQLHLPLPPPYPPPQPQPQPQQPVSLADSSLAQRLANYTLLREAAAAAAAGSSAGSKRAVPQTVLGQDRRLESELTAMLDELAAEQEHLDGLEHVRRLGSGGSGGSVPGAGAAAGGLLSVARWTSGSGGSGGGPGSGPSSGSDLQTAAVTAPFVGLPSTSASGLPSGSLAGAVRPQLMRLMVPVLSSGTLSAMDGGGVTAFGELTADGGVGGVGGGAAAATAAAVAMMRGGSDPDVGPHTPGVRDVDQQLPSAERGDALALTEDQELEGFGPRRLTAAAVLTGVDWEPSGGARLFGAGGLFMGAQGDGGGGGGGGPAAVWRGGHADLVPPGPRTVPGAQPSAAVTLQAGSGDGPAAWQLPYNTGMALQGPAQVQPRMSLGPESREDAPITSDAAARHHSLHHQHQYLQQRHAAHRPHAGSQPLDQPRQPYPQTLLQPAQPHGEFGLDQGLPFLGAAAAAAPALRPLQAVPAVLQHTHVPLTAQQQPHQAAAVSLMGSSEQQTPYHPGQLLHRLSLKLYGCSPSDLMPDSRSRLQAWLANMNLQMLQLTVRSGCAHLIADVLVPVTSAAERVAPAAERVAPAAERVVTAAAATSAAAAAGTEAAVAVLAAAGNIVGAATLPAAAPGEGTRPEGSGPGMEPESEEGAAGGERAPVRVGQRMLVSSTPTGAAAVAAAAAAATVTAAATDARNSPLSPSLLESESRDGSGGGSSGRTAASAGPDPEASSSFLMSHSHPEEHSTHSNSVSSDSVEVEVLTPHTTRWRGSRRGNSAPGAAAPPAALALPVAPALLLPGTPEQRRAVAGAGPPEERLVEEGAAEGVAEDDDQALLLALLSRLCVSESANEVELRDGSLQGLLRQLLGPGYGRPGVGEAEAAGGRLLLQLDEKAVQLTWPLPGRSSIISGGGNAPVDGAVSSSAPGMSGGAVSSVQPISVLVRPPELLSVNPLAVVAGRSTHVQAMVRLPRPAAPPEAELLDGPAAGERPTTGVRASLSPIGESPGGAAAVAAPVATPASDGTAAVGVEQPSLLLLLRYGGCCLWSHDLRDPQLLQIASTTAARSDEAAANGATAASSLPINPPVGMESPPAVADRITAAAAAVAGPPSAEAATPPFERTSPEEQPTADVTAAVAPVPDAASAAASEAASESLEPCGPVATVSLQLPSLPSPGLAFLESSAGDVLGRWLPLLVVPGDAMAEELGELASRLAEQSGEVSSSWVDRGGGVDCCGGSGGGSGGGGGSYGGGSGGGSVGPTCRSPIEAFLVDLGRLLMLESAASCMEEAGYTDDWEAYEAYWELLDAMPDAAVTAGRVLRQCIEWRLPECTRVATSLLLALLQEPL